MNAGSRYKGNLIVKSGVARPWKLPVWPLESNDNLMSARYAGERDVLID